MEIVWSKRAIASLQDVYDFISLQSPNAADKVVNGLVDKADTILPYPEKHQVEEALGLPFRYVVSGNYKIIFRPYYNTIRIYQVFDTRQNPAKLKAND